MMDFLDGGDHYAFCPICGKREDWCECKGDGRMTENQRRGAHFYVIFSETVKSHEYIVDMMIEKLSFDKRIEEWGYLNPEEVFDTIAEESDDNL